MARRRRSAVAHHSILTPLAATVPARKWRSWECHLDDELLQSHGFCNGLAVLPLPDIYGLKAPGSAACDPPSTLRNSAQQRHKNARRRVFAEAACSVSRAYEASDARIFPRAIDRRIFGQARILR